MLTCCRYPQLQNNQLNLSFSSRLSIALLFPLRATIQLGGGYSNDILSGQVQMPKGVGLIGGTRPSLISESTEDRGFQNSWGYELIYTSYCTVILFYKKKTRPTFFYPYLFLASSCWHCWCALLLFMDDVWIFWKVFATWCSGCCGRYDAHVAFAVRARAIDESFWVVSWVITQARSWYGRKHCRHERNRARGKKIAWIRLSMLWYGCLGMQNN